MPRRRTTTRPPLDRTPVHDWLRQRGVAWDVALFGDGSGTGWQQGCGWACIVIVRQSRGRKTLCGGMSHGTVNLGEAMAYVHGLHWCAVHLPRDAGQFIRAAIVSDSQHTVDTGNKVQRQLSLDGVSANRPAWAALLDCMRSGFQTQFLWQPRATTELNVYADALAGEARVAAENVAIYEPLLGDALTAYDFNSASARANHLTGGRHADGPRD